MVRLFRCVASCDLNDDPVTDIWLGAPFQWAAIFDKEDINFANGHEGLEWYDAKTGEAKHTLPCKVRCSYCQTPIMDEGRRMIQLFPTLIKMETEEARKCFSPR